VPSRIVEATIEVNRAAMRMMSKIQALVELGPTIAVLGLLQPMTDDTRDSVGIDLVRMLRRGGEVRAFDPVAMERAARVLPDDYFAKDSMTQRKGPTVWSSSRSGTSSASPISARSGAC
jgi:UDPglucose 6-dehydrogenase